MSREVYADRENYTIEVDEEIGAVVHTWDQFAASEAFQEGCGELLDAIREEDSAKVLVDVSGIRAHQDEDKQWLQEEWVPRAIDAGIEYSVTVPADSAISEMEIKRFDEQASDVPFTTAVASDVEEARQWLAEQDV